MRPIKAETIIILPNRQRKEIDSAALLDLASSIAKVGLLHPIVVRYLDGALYLVAGERRMKAIETLWMSNDSVMCDGKNVPEGYFPCTLLEELSPLEAMEAELEENICRVDLSWQERCEITAKLEVLRTAQAAAASLPPPTTLDLAATLRPDQHPNAAQKAVREELILARYLSDPEVAAAKTQTEGFKVIKRKEEAKRNVALGEAVGRTFSSKDHSLIRGNCLDVLTVMIGAQETFDVILTDPPYGIDAQNFNDSGGKANAAGHIYDDSLATWRTLMAYFSQLSFAVTKPQAHLYCFCDIDNFIELRGLMATAGWQCFRTPLVWHNPSSQRAPWPQHGPHRRYQLCLYAIKNGRPTLRLAPDVVEYRSDNNLGWAAQKPIDLYCDLLSRSCRPGDRALDPFCGSGTIFPAAHGLKIAATGIELDEVAYGIAVKRLGELK
jgi:ParB-like chromosome segregation protein Spo0J